MSRIALITGGSRGIGRAWADALAEAGFRKSIRHRQHAATSVNGGPARNTAVPRVHSPDRQTA